MAGGRLPLRALFPKATPEQMYALVKGLPVPPSADWSGAQTAPQLTAEDADPELMIERSPLVTAVMVFGEPQRSTLAQRCINRFLLQTYENKELVVINASGKKLTNVEHPQVREIAVAGPLTLGAMRNIGLREAHGKWVTMWDDDDLPNYHYLEYMMLRRVEGQGMALRRQIRTSVTLANAFLLDEEGGVPATLFFQPTPEHKYHEADLNETAMFYNEYFAGRCAVIDNNLYPTTCISIAVHHGHNVTPVEEFMRELAAPNLHGRCLLRDLERDHLAFVLASIGISMKVKGKEAQAQKQESVG